MDNFIYIEAQLHIGITPDTTSEWTVQWPDGLDLSLMEGINETLRKNIQIAMEKKTYIPVELFNRLNNENEEVRWQTGFTEEATPVKVRIFIEEGKISDITIL